MTRQVRSTLTRLIGFGLLAIGLAACNQTTAGTETPAAVRAVSAEGGAVALLDQDCRARLGTQRSAACACYAQTMVQRMGPVETARVVSTGVPWGMVDGVGAEVLAQCRGGRVPTQVVAGAVTGIIRSSAPASPAAAPAVVRPDPADPASSRVPVVPAAAPVIPAPAPAAMPAPIEPAPLFVPQAAAARPAAAAPPASSAMPAPLDPPPLYVPQASPGGATRED